MTVSLTMTGSGTVGDVASWSIAEQAVPINIADPAATLGNINLTCEATLTSKYVLGNGVRFYPKYNPALPGSNVAYLGNVYQASIDVDAVNFSATMLPAALSVVRTAPPVMNMTLDDIIVSYAALASPSLLVLSFVFDDTLRSFPGWTGNVWEMICQLCAAFRIDIRPALGGDALGFYPYGPSEYAFDRGSDIVNPQLVIDSSDAAQSVQVVYQNSVAVTNGLMYDAGEDDNRVLSVDAGQLNVVTVTTQNSPTAIYNPVQVNSPTTVPGRYYVIDSAGTPVNTTVWAKAKGKVTAKLGSVPGTIDVTLVGPKLPIAGYQGPFYLASIVGTDKKAEFTLAGDGVRIDPNTLVIPTGMNPTLPPDREPLLIDSPFINTLKEAYTTGAWAATKFAGRPTKLHLEIADQAAYSAGDVISYNGSNYRVTATERSQTGKTLDCDWHVETGKFDELWAGRTAGDLDVEWINLDAGDFIVAPLDPYPGW